jgi:glucosylglycerate synthase
VETDSIARQAPEEDRPIDSADLVVGILGGFDSDGLAMVCDGLRALPDTPRIAILQTDPAPNGTAGTELHSPADAGASLFFVSTPLPKADASGAPALGMAAAYQSIFAAAEQLGARGCCVFASHIHGATPAWVAGLAEPLLAGDLDLVVPRYTQRKFDGLLNACIISPLMRTLYGKRIHNPMGPDLAVSQRLFRLILNANQKGGSGGVHSLASLAPAAVCSNLQICEVHASPRVYPPVDWANISSLLSAILGPVFLDMERNAACWQRMRGSVSVRALGQPVSVSEDSGQVDVERMVESFQLGNRELQEIWGLVLPPATLLELRKLLRLPPDQFRMDDAVWVRIVYDFALAHRLRTISRDHLLKSMTPLYLGWVASYARELQDAGTSAVEQRLERLALAYESAKPYLVSRWRWPDRFSP